MSALALGAGLLVGPAFVRPSVEAPAAFVSVAAAQERVTDLEGDASERDALERDALERDADLGDALNRETDLDRDPDLERETDLERGADMASLETLELGDAWVPPIFSHSESPFAPSFVALANERFDDVEPDLAARARLDRFLESYGIPPSLGVIKRRLAALDELSCVGGLDLAAIEAFAGADLDEDDAEAWEAQAQRQATAWLERTRLRYDPYGMAALDELVLNASERRRRGRALPLTQWASGMYAIRQRLACEGHLRGRVPTEPDLDRKTRAALAEFERRHRIYTRGALSGETLRALRIHPLELLRHDLLRVITERARLDWGILEDGSAGGDDLVRQVQVHVEQALGLEDVQGMRRFLADHHDEPSRQVTVPAFPLPDDYDAHMALHVEIDRGDVRYDPPFDAQGNYVEPRPRVRPSLTVFVGTQEDRRALVRWPTTIGGWRTERIRGQTMWTYKESPAGVAQWAQIVGAPVWLPPPSTPDEDLVHELRLEDGTPQIVLKRTLLGPGYASAYGLAAAIHQPIRRGRVGTDEGIRTHGSVDYTSVWRRASHGCHRLQNHRAVALFSFILAHRRHRYRGPRRVNFRRTVQLPDESLELAVDRTGEIYLLEPPLPVEVLEGRIVGRSRRLPRETYPVQLPTP